MSLSDEESATYSHEDIDSKKILNELLPSGNQNTTAELAPSGLMEAPQALDNSFNEYEGNPQPMTSSNLIFNEEANIPSATNPPIEQIQSSAPNSEEGSGELESTRSGNSSPQVQPILVQDGGLLEVAGSNLFTLSSERSSEEHLESPRSNPQLPSFPSFQEDIYDVVDRREPTLQRIQHHIPLNINGEVRIDELPSTPRFGQVHLEGQSIVISLCFILSAITIIHLLPDDWLLKKW